MKKNFLLFLLMLLLPSMATGKEVAFEWCPIGQAIGYKIRWGTTEGVYPDVVDVGNTLEYKISFDDSDNNKYFFTLSSYTLEGESDPSAPIMLDFSQQLIVEDVLTNYVGSCMKHSTRDYVSEFDSASFDGATSFVLVPTPHVGSQYVVYNGKFKTTSIASRNPLFSCGGYWFGCLEVGIQNGKLWIETWHGDSWENATTTKKIGSIFIGDEQWHNIEIKFIKGYVIAVVDGNIDLSYYVANNLYHSLDSKIYLGQNVWGSDHFSGKMRYAAINVGYPQLIADYLFASTTVDSTINKNNATTEGGVAYLNKATFPGTNLSRIHLPKTIIPNNNLIIESEFDTTDNDCSLNTVASIGGGYGYGGVDVRVQCGQIKIGVFENSEWTESKTIKGNSFTLNDGQKHKIAIMAVDNLIAVFVDQKLEITTSINKLAFAPYAEVFLGCNGWGNECFKGSIYETKIYRVDSKVANLKVDTATVTENSGFSLPINIQGPIELAPSVVTIQGTNQTFLELTKKDGWDSSKDWELQLEFNTSNTCRLNTVATDGGGYGRGGVIAGVQCGNLWLEVFENNWWQGRRIGDTVNYGDNQWHAMKISKTGKSIAVFIDNIKRLETTVSGLFYADSPSKLLIGCNGWGNECFTGQIKNVNLNMPLNRNN